MKTTWLLLDVNYLCYRSLFSTGGLSHKGEGTGVVFGVLRDIKNLQDLHNTDHIAFCFDYGVSFRKNIYPGYKNRKDKLEPHVRKDFNRQVRKLRTEYLEEVGFKNVLYAEGYEADDIIAAVVEEYQQTDVEFIVVSADKDLYQLLTFPNVSIWHPTKDKMVTAVSFTQQWGIPPDLWVHVKAIAGCSTDTIPGVEGVGEKTAAKYVGGLPLGKATRLKIKGMKPIWKRNLSLVKLPYPGTPVYELEADKVSNKAWRALTDRLGMTTLRESTKPRKETRQGFGVGR